MAASGRAQSAILNRSSPEPLYRQLAAHLESDVRSGRLGPGDRLESEGALMQRFQVSRITLRQAVEELVRKQLLVRKQGKGTFVTAPAVRHDLRRLHGLLGSLFSQSDAASAKLLRYELAVPPADMRGAFNLGAGQQALALERVYLIGRKPVAFAQDWLAPEVGALPRAKAELISTEDMMRAVGIRIASSEVAIRAEAAGATAGRALKLPARSPVLVLRRKAFGEDGKVKEAGRLWFRSDAYEFVCATQSHGQVGSVFDIRNVTEPV